ncbi:MAG: LacI family DNA-binding transcriptional regulator [Spirochaetota bacterium]
MATLRDIAVEVGVSIRTVSRALSDNGYVRADLKERIVEVADRLGYRPDPVAQSLRLGRSRQIVVVSHSVDELHMAKIASLERHVRAQGLTVSVVMSTQDEMNSIALLPEIRARKPWGTVLIGTLGSDVTLLAEALYRAGIPSIAVDAACDYPAVLIDRPAGVTEAAGYLVSTGRRRIVYLGPSESRSRIEGFSRAMREHDRETLLFDPGASRSRTVTAAGLLERYPHADAVQAYSDEWALELIAGLHARGVRVPDDVAVVGFDDRWAASYSWPALTTVAQPSAAIGEAVAEVLAGSPRERLDQLCALTVRADQGLRDGRNARPGAGRSVVQPNSKSAAVRQLVGELTRRIPTKLIVRESA